MFDNKHLKLKKEENNKKINNKISILRKGKLKEFNNNNESDEDNIENLEKNKINNKNNVEKESILELNIKQNIKKSNNYDNKKKDNNNNNNYKLENNDSENSEIENINFPKLNNQNEREKKLYNKYLKNNSESDSEKNNSENNSNSSSEKEEDSENNESESPKFIEPSQRQNSNNNNFLTFSENNPNEKEKQNKISIINHIIEISKQKKLNKKKINNEKDIELNLPDDTDNPDDLDEYEKWKIRELKRIKKNFIEKQEKLNEKIEIERRRNLTDEQRQEENLKLGSDSTLKNFKSKIKYLQKYYHKGAFFQDEAINNSEHIYNRDFNLPTWEDSIERNGLPKILEKRRGNLFKKSQSKYTHLTAEDTTNFDPTFRIPENINNNILKKIGGYKKI